jgi:hypothetical protein
MINGRLLSLQQQQGTHDTNGAREGAIWDVREDG